MPEMLIGGEWRAGSAHREIEVINPATEEPVASVPAGSADDVELAVETAKRAFPDWSRTDMEQRAAILAKAADLIHENAKALAGTLTSEQGKPVAEAIGEVNHLAHGVRYYAEAATKVRGAYQDLPSSLGRSYGLVIRRPMGVCAAITPYNFPLTLLGTKVAPALAGQACLGGKRVFVHDSVYDAFVSQLVERVGRYEPGDGTVKAEKPKLRMGPIHTRAGRDELLEQIEDGVSSGGELLIGGGMP